MLYLTIAQLNPTVGDLEGNTRRILERAREAHERVPLAPSDGDAHVLVFPELSVTGYYPGDLFDEPDFMPRVARCLEQIRGDTNGGLGLIGDLYKTEVFALSAHLNAAAGSALIPASVLEKPPSAELAPGQKDTDSFAAVRAPRRSAQGVDRGQAPRPVGRRARGRALRRALEDGRGRGLDRARGA